MPSRSISTLILPLLTEKNKPHNSTVYLEWQGCLVIHESSYIQSITFRDCRHSCVNLDGFVFL